jgi:hypothetical protein
MRNAQNLLAFYGDSEGHDVLAIDVDNMSLLAQIPTGEGPYPVDRVADDLLYAITRKVCAVTPITISTLSAGPEVRLTHQPRSASRGANAGGNAGLALVSGADRPLTTVVDVATGQTIMRAGRDVTGVVDGYGGPLASGHERWLDADRFFLLDRLAPAIAVHRLGDESGPVWSVATPGPVHHVVNDPELPSRWYGICEGRPKAGVPPSVVVIDAAPSQPGGFAVVAVVDVPVAAGDIGASGAHHGDIRPEAGLLFVGSAEGYTHGLRRDTLEFVLRGRTGPGCGHTGFAKVAGAWRAVTINHTAAFVSVLDATTGAGIVDIQVSNSAATTKRTQGHTSYRVGDKFYMMASLDARFLEIDLRTGAIARSLDLGSDLARPYPMQGVFVPPPARIAAGAVFTQCC